jgi:hypothetical protein
MRECIAEVEQLSRLIEELWANMSADALANVQELRPWLRTSVERCVFTRVSQTLWHLYDGRHSAEDAQFAEKSAALSKVSDLKLMEELGVRVEFRGNVESSSSSSPGGASASSSACASPVLNVRSGGEDLESSMVGSSQASLDDSTVVDSEEASSHKAHLSRKVVPLTLKSVGGPFERATAALSQIEVALLSGQNCTPREVVEALTLSQFEMKTCALEASGGQIELVAMDDIMPLWIFIVARSSLTKPFAAAKFMSDALSQDERLDSEGQVVLLLESAARHIAYDWNIDHLVDSQ